MNSLIYADLCFAGFVIILMVLFGLIVWYSLQDKEKW